MLHPWHDLSPGPRVPYEFYGVIEIPLRSNVKYELDKTTGLLRVDQILGAVYFPANYGFVPQTLAEDGDPLDLLVLCQEAVAPLALIKARTIGLMKIVDSSTLDYEIVAVAVNDPEFSEYTNADHIPAHYLSMIRRFFRDYKQPERKTVDMEEIQPAKAAYPIIQAALNRYGKKYRVTGSRSTKGQLIHANRSFER